MASWRSIYEVPLGALSSIMGGMGDGFRGKVDTNEPYENDPAKKSRAGKVIDKYAGMRGGAKTGEWMGKWGAALVVGAAALAFVVAAPLSLATIGYAAIGLVATGFSHAIGGLVGRWTGTAVGAITGALAGGLVGAYSWAFKRGYYKEPEAQNQSQQPQTQQPQTHYRRPQYEQTQYSQSNAPSTQTHRQVSSYDVNFQEPFYSHGFVASEAQRRGIDPSQMAPVQNDQAPNFRQRVQSPNGGRQWAGSRG